MIELVRSRPGAREPWTPQKGKRRPRSVDAVLVDDERPEQVFAYVGTRARFGGVRPSHWSYLFWRVRLGEAFGWEQNVLLSSAVELGHVSMPDVVSPASAWTTDGRPVHSDFLHPADFLSWNTPREPWHTHSACYPWPDPDVLSCAPATADLHDIALLEALFALARQHRAAGVR